MVPENIIFWRETIPGWRPDYTVELGKICGSSPGQFFFDTTSSSVGTESTHYTGSPGTNSGVGGGRGGRRIQKEKILSFSHEKFWINTFNIFSLLLVGHFFKVSIAVLKRHWRNGKNLFVQLLKDDIKIPFSTIHSNL